MPEEGKADIAQPLKKAPLSRAVDLSRQWGGLNKIPDDLLGEIGFRRAGDNIAPLEGYEIGDDEKVEEKRKTVVYKDIEEKTRDAPFGEIRIVLSGRDIPFRRLSETQVTKLEHEFVATYDQLEDTTGRTYIPQNYPIRTLIDRFRVNVDELREVDDYLRDEVFWSSALAIIDHFQNFTHETEAAKLIRDHLTDDLIMSVDLSEKLYMELERAKGKYADITELRRDFMENQNDEFPEYNPPEGEYFEKRGLKTNFDAVKFLFGKFLESEEYQLNTLSQKLQNCPSLDGVIDVLTVGRDEALKPYVDQERELKNSIKTASIEEKKKLSGRIKEIREKKDKIRTILDGMIQYYNTPELVAEIISRKINELQDFLVGGKADDEEIELILDGRPNKKFDEDPGAISGDCTEGRPLPFDDPATPVFNVKVFDKEKRHMGNMYLLSITEMDTDRNVWHLDAIQIPEGRIEWADAIPQLIKSLGEEAEKKGVDIITVNNEKHLVSNYDYISDAVFKYMDRNDHKEVHINIPDVDQESYSSFQSHGVGRVIWEARTKTKQT